MKTGLVNRTKSRLGKGLHCGLIENGISALVGIGLAFILRMALHRYVPIRFDGRMIFEVILGAAFISYCLAACERWHPLLYGIIAASMGVAIPIASCMFSSAGWVGPFAACFASAFGMKPLSAWVSRILLSAGEDTKAKPYLSSWRRRPGYRQSLKVAKVQASSSRLLRSVAQARRSGPTEASTFE